MFFIKNNLALLHLAWILFGLILLIIMILILNRYSQDSFQQLIDEHIETKKAEKAERDKVLQEIQIVKV